MRKILLIGANGLLGRKLLQTAPVQYTIIPTYHKKQIPSAIQLDITNAHQTFQSIQKVKPYIIFHTASIGNIDYCQVNQKEAWGTNVKGTINVINAARKIGARMVFFSSNAVFDGQNPPYSETDTVHPIHYYGKTKAAVEKLVQQYDKKWIIFRFTTLYGWNDLRERQNPATFIIERLRRNEKTYLVTDRYNNYLWVDHAADAIWKAIEKECYGQIFHIAGSETTNRYVFSQYVAEVFGFDTNLLVPVMSDYFKGMTPRPINNSLDTKRAQRILDIQPLSIYEGLLQMKQDPYEIHH